MGARGSREENAVSTEQLVRTAEQESRPQSRPQTSARSMSLRDFSAMPEEPAPPAPPSFLKQQFPHLRWRSVQGVFIVMEFVVFWVACLVIQPRGWVTPDPLANWKLGSSDRIMEQCAYVLGGEYWVELRRAVVPVFLHVNLPHILMNLYFQFSEGTTAEVEFGAAKFLLLFLVSGIAGNLLSDAFGVSGVGASTSCYGLIGVQMGRLFVVEWPHISDAQTKQRLQEHWSRVAGMLLFWEVMNWSTIDHYGHLGGFLSGACVGCLLNKQRSVRFSPLPGGAGDAGVYGGGGNGNGSAMVAPTRKQRAWSAVFLGALIFGSAFRIYWTAPEGELEILCPQLRRRYFLEVNYGG